MSKYPRLAALPAASGTEPGLISPAAYNAIRKSFLELDNRFDQIGLISSSDIGVNFSPAGCSLFLKRRVSPTSSMPLQFQVSFSGGRLVAAAGVLASTNIAAITEEDPADGVWYLRAKVVIVGATGAVTSQEMIWTQTEDDNTATTFYRTVASITLEEGEEMDRVQYNYGPFIVFPTGTPSAVWQVVIL